MKNIYMLTISCLTFIAALLPAKYVFANDFAQSRIDTSYLHIQKTKAAAKNSYLKNGLHLTLPPLKPAATSTLKVNIAHVDDKLLSDVQVYPNPVTDQINLKCMISKSALVTIKVMDLLGNDVSTVYSQRVEPGELKVTYFVQNKLTHGFYFVRIVVGTESVIKRISVL
jgi:hypothetical protein